MKRKREEKRIRERKMGKYYNKRDPSQYLSKLALLRSINNAPLSSLLENLTLVIPKSSKHIII